MTWRSMPTSLPAGTRTCTAPCVEKNFFTLDFWQVTLTVRNSSGASSSFCTTSSFASLGRSQSSVVLRPILSQASIGFRACSSSFLHCLPHAESGCKLCSASGIWARKARPKTSIARSSCSDSAASPCGGTRKTERPSMSARVSRFTSCRKSETVALIAHVTCSSPSGKCASTLRFLVLGGSTFPKMFSASPLDSWPRKCAANSMTSRLRASSRCTSLRRMEFEVFPPCCTCRQMPKSSWKRPTVMSPFRNWSCFTKLKSSPMLMSPYGRSSAACLL
mmetsp:Transcript_111923/g.297500  ORF Transcript_111923/g.297500 Transcript_111923/m.297500 type:complete len:277 (-) Transcript_111923:84-914(-)